VDDGAAARTEAQAAAECGDWEVVTLLADCRPADREQHVAVAFLRARAALHGDAPARALEALDGLVEILVRPDERATAAMLRGAALVALGRHDEGLALLDQAAATALGHRRFEALLGLARAYWRAERFGEVGPVLDAILSADAAGAAPAGILARTYELYGWLELARHRRPIAARHFGDALGALAWSSQPEPQLHAALLHGLLAIAIDTLDLRLLERVRAEIGQADWRAVTLQARKRAILPLLALGALLLGDLDAAWEIGCALRAQAAPGLQQIVADLTAADVAWAAGETWTPARLVGHAAAGATEVSWADTGAAGARTLLRLIAAAAATDPDAARASRDLRGAAPRTRAAQPEDESDLLPLEYLARAGVAGAAGDAKRQVVELRRAIARWHEVGNDYGELRSALALVELTGDGHVLARADALTRLVPRSWLRHAYASLAPRALGVQKLSPTEQRVLWALVEGLSTKQIAARFGRSPNTIRNARGALNLRHPVPDRPRDGIGPAAGLQHRNERRGREGNLRDPRSSARTLGQFEDACSGLLVLRDIDRVFGDSGIERGNDPREGSWQRRTLFRDYYAASVNQNASPRR
jgi:DNA-binding CsgD family transcriptional regulator/tetratricopeptide (TPR) repeat protein